MKILAIAETLIDIAAAMEVMPRTEAKLQSLAPFVKGGNWVTQGRMKHRLLAILGVAQFQVLLSNQRFAELIMLQAAGVDLEQTLKYVLGIAIIANQLPLGYTNLLVVLTQDANVCPVGTHHLTKNEPVPLTINQLLLRVTWRWELGDLNCLTFIWIVWSRTLEGSVISKE